MLCLAAILCSCPAMAPTLQERSPLIRPSGRSHAAIAEDGKVGDRINLQSRCVFRYPGCIGTWEWESREWLAVRYEKGVNRDSWRFERDLSTSEGAISNTLVLVGKIVVCSLTQFCVDSQYCEHDVMLSAPHRMLVLVRDFFLSENNVCSKASFAIEAPATAITSLRFWLWLLNRSSGCHRLFRALRTRNDQFGYLADGGGGGERCLIWVSTKEKLTLAG